MESEASCAELVSWHSVLKALTHIEQAHDIVKFAFWKVILSGSVKTGLEKEGLRNQLRV